MKRSSVLNKFDKKVQEMYEALDNLKEVLDNTEDYELAELAEGFCEQIEESMAEGNINIQQIKDCIQE
jgi:predicted DNA-binding protein